MTKSKIIGDTVCPRCRENGGDKKGDHLILFENGGAFCNRCSYSVNPGGDAAEPAQANAPNNRITLEDIQELEPMAVESRGLSAKYMELYGHRVAVSQTDRTPTHICYPRYIEGTLSGWKIKDLATKQYFSVGDSKGCDLSGMEVDGGKKLCIVTEGEDDAVAVKQMLGTKDKNYTVVSLPNGATSRLNEYSANYLASFESVAIATDMDKEGDKAADKLVDLLPAGICKRILLPAKDGNQCLLEGLTDEFFTAFYAAKKITPDGVVLGENTWDNFITDYRREASGGIEYPEGWDELNEMVYGVRLSELDTYTSGSGMGKTQLLREMMYNLAINHGKRTGVLSLEEPLSDTVMGQMGIAANKPLHLPEIRAAISDEELQGYWQQTFGTGKYVAYDHFGSLGQDTLISKIRYMAAGVGCQYIVLDHLSIVVSETAQQGDERKAIDEIMTKLKRLTQELNIWIGLVVHLRKAGGTPFELGAVPSVDDLRGSGGIKQLSNQVIALSRNQQHPDLQIRNTSQITVLKSRFTGRTGPANLLQYDQDTGRMRRSMLDYNQYHEHDKALPKWGSKDD